MLVEWLPYLDASLSIFRFYRFVERKILIDVDMLRDLDLPLSLKVDFLNFFVCIRITGNLRNVVSHDS